MQHTCKCHACRARDAQAFQDIVARNYSARTLARLERLAAPLERAPESVARHEPCAAPPRRETAAMLHLIARAEDCARATGDSSLADDLYALGLAIAAAEARHNERGDNV